MKTNATILSEFQKKFTTPEFSIEDVEIPKPTFAGPVGIYEYIHTPPLNLRPNGKTLICKILPDTTELKAKFRFDFSGMWYLFDIEISGDPNFIYKRFYRLQATNNFLEAVFWERIPTISGIGDIFKLKSRQFWRVRQSGWQWSDVAFFDLKFVFSGSEGVDEE